MTHREAALLLGVHVSLIPRMLRRDDLTSRRKRPSWSRDEVLELATARKERAAERERRRKIPRLAGPRPPDEEDEWLLVPTAAVVLGYSEGALRMRANRGRVPFTVQGGRRWFRLDHLELLVRAQVARSTLKV